LAIGEEEGAFVGITIEAPKDQWEQVFETLKETPYIGILHLKDGTSGTMIFSKSFDDLAASPDVKVQELFAGVKYEIEWGVAAELKKMIAQFSAGGVDMFTLSLIAMDVQGAVGYNQKALNEFKTPMSDMTWGGSLKDMVAHGMMEGTEEPRAMALDVFQGLKGIESAHFSFSLPETELQLFDESGRQDSYRSVNLSMEYENFNCFTFAETVLTTLTTIEKKHLLFPTYIDVFWDCLLKAMQAEIETAHATVDSANQKLTPAVEAIYSEFAGNATSMSKDQWAVFLSAFADSCLLLDGKIRDGEPGKKAEDALQSYKDQKEAKDEEAFNLVAKDGVIGKAEVVAALVLGKREPVPPPTPESMLAQKGIRMSALWEHMHITSQG